MNTNQRKDPVNRPGRRAFLAMAGAFFVVCSLPVFYWAVHSESEQSRITVFVQQLRGDVDNPQLLADRQGNIDRIYWLSASADRKRLETRLSLAGGLVLLGLAALAFRRTMKARQLATPYQPIAPGVIEIPDQPIEVQFRRIYGVLVAGLILSFGGLLSLNVYNNCTSPLIAPESAILRSLVLGVPIIALLAALSFLMIRLKRNSVRVISSSGVERGDGRHFPWAEFCGVIAQTDFNHRIHRRYVWRIELAFLGGERAWLVPHRIQNYDAVFQCISKLPAAMIATRVNGPS